MIKTEEKTDVQKMNIGEKLAGKYLTFKMGAEEYGIDILKVQEIIFMQPVTRVPKAPDFVRGVINLRGKVIPLIDLRKKFDMEEVPDTIKTCIVVGQVTRNESVVVMGMVIDEVREVILINAQDIEESPDFGVQINTDFIKGMGKLGSSVKILLDFDKVLTVEELNELATAAN